MDTLNKRSIKMK